MLYLVNKSQCSNNNNDSTGSFDFIDQFVAVQKRCHEFTCTTCNKVFGIQSVRNRVICKLYIKRTKKKKKNEVLKK